MAAGDIIEIPDPALVTTPNGETVRVVGGRYVLELDGDHDVQPVED
ncbi:hypothetical protein JCM18899A_13880 [Nocardioides sp. AN3]